MRRLTFWLLSTLLRLIIHGLDRGLALQRRLADRWGLRIRW